MTPMTPERVTPQRHACNIDESNQRYRDVLNRLVMDVELIRVESDVVAEKIYFILIRKRGLKALQIISSLSAVGSH